MKKKNEEEGEEEEHVEQKAPKKKAKKVAEKIAKPETGKRPLSVDGIVNKGSKERPWEKSAPWNRKDPKRNSRFEHARTSSNNKN